MCSQQTAWKQFNSPSRLIINSNIESYGWKTQWDSAGPTLACYSFVSVRLVLLAWLVEFFYVLNNSCVLTFFSKHFVRSTVAILFRWSSFVWSVISSVKRWTHNLIDFKQERFGTILTNWKKKKKLSFVWKIFKILKPIEQFPNKIRSTKNVKSDSIPVAMTKQTIIWI